MTGTLAASSSIAYRGIGDISLYFVVCGSTGYWPVEPQANNKTFPVDLSIYPKTIAHLLFFPGCQIIFSYSNKILVFNLK
jgi:hypothetical protein